MCSQQWKEYIKNKGNGICTDCNKYHSYQLDTNVGFAVLTAGILSVLYFGIWCHVEVRGLLFKVKNVFPIQYYRLLQSYLLGREFRTRVNEEVSSNVPIQSGVPQGSVLGPILYVLFTTDLPTNFHTTTETFADDTVILASHDDPVIASQRLQGHLDQLENWLKRGESTLMKPNLRRSPSHWGQNSVQQYT
jgi:hypothetical protein